MDKDLPEKKAEKIEEKSQKLTGFLERYYRIITLLSLTAVAIFGYYILAPKYEEVGLGGQYSITTLTREKQQKQRYLQELKELVGNYQRINQTDIDKLNQILPKDKDIAGLFVQLQALSRENGFILSSVNINQEPVKSSKSGAKDEIRKLNISLNLIGSDYQSLKRLLEAIEYNLRLFDVNAVYFSPGVPRYSINLFTYYNVAAK